MVRNAIKKAMLALLATLLFQNGAAAFTRQQAEQVVSIMEALADDFGDLFYDEAAADHWFEEDGIGEGRIVSAGYTQERWRDAVERTMTGFYASLDRAAVESMFETMMDFEARPDFSADQKDAIRQMVRETREKMARWRAEGAAHVSAVAPYAPRIKAVLDIRIGE